MPYKPAILTATQARACCQCAHWRPRPDETKGECLKAYHGVVYRNEETGEETFVEYWTTGRYASCRLWMEKNSTQQK